MLIVPLVQVITACVYCLLASGVVFGYAAFKQVLVAEGVYSELCPESHRRYPGQTCYEQELRYLVQYLNAMTYRFRLNIMFVVSATLTNIVALPVGTILDRYGPRVSGTIGSLLIALGCIFFIIAASLPFDAYIPGYLFLALGGPFIFISSFQLSNCFPRHSGLILALLTGAFDTSSAVFLVYRLIYATDTSFNTSRFFLVYLAVPGFILLAQFLIMPASSYKTVGETLDSTASSTNGESPNGTISSMVQEESIREQRERRIDSVLDEMAPLIPKPSENEIRLQRQEKNQISGVFGALHGKSAIQQIQTPWFFLMTAFVVIQMTRINYFVATIFNQYKNLLGPEEARSMNNLFDIALPVGGVLSIPFIGLILDNFSTVTTLSILVIIATTIGIAGCLPYTWSAVCNIILFVLYRPFYYTAVSDYSAKVFGFHTFGKVYGLIICISGLMNLSQSGLDALRHHVFADDPVPVNVILLALALLVGTALVLFVHKRSNGAQRDVLEHEAEDAEPEPMPDFSDGANIPSHASGS